MKIGVYNPRVGTKEVGGTETFLRKMVDRIDNDIVLFTGEGKVLDDVQKMDIEVVQVPVIYKEDSVSKMISDWSPILSAEIESITMFANARRKVWDKIRSCDVISTHYYMDNILISRSVDVPTLFRFPGVKNPSLRWKAMVRFAKPDLYVCNSNSTQKRLNEWFGMECYETIYAGVDVDRFSPNTEPSHKHDEFIVLFVGRLDEGKGVKDLIDAHSKLPEKIILRIVGDGRKKDEYERYASEKLDSERYEFVGSVNHEHIHEEYRGADAFCLPSYHESFGIVVMEALASGVPVLSTKIDAISEYITDGENGFLVPPGAVDQLEKRLHDIYENDELRQYFSQKGRETAVEYSWENQSEKMRECYKKAIEVSQ